METRNSDNRKKQPYAGKLVKLGYCRLLTEGIDRSLIKWKRISRIDFALVVIRKSRDFNAIVTTPLLLNATIYSS